LSDTQYTDRYMAYMGLSPKRVPHWKHWSCPDAETYLTGIDYYEHPKRCRERLRELYPQLDLPVPATDDPEEIRAMVTSMVETANMTGGYMMCIGNHIPWNIPPPAIQLYLDLSAEMAHR